MNCTTCHGAIEAGAAFCGHCGQPLVAPREPLSQRHDPSRLAQPGRPQRGITLEREAIRILPPEATRHTPPDLSIISRHPAMKRVTAELPNLSAGWRELSPSSLQAGLIEPITSVPQPHHHSFARSILILVTIILLISSIAVGAYALAKTSSIGGFHVSRSFTTQIQGQITFSDGASAQGTTDSVTITLKQLSAPDTNSHYQAWLIDDQGEHITYLGQLTEQGTDYVLKRSMNRRNLLSLGNRIEVTQEHGNVSVPTGKTVFKASFPPMAFIHLRHLLVRLDETPGQVGLLVGLREQAQALNAQVALLKGREEQAQTVRCVAQNIVNIIEGKQGTHYANLLSACQTAHITPVGDGFGLLGKGAYIEDSLMHVSLAATQSDSTSTIKQHAGQVRASLENIRDWATQLDQTAIKLLYTPEDIAGIQESLILCKQIFQGRDANGDKRIDAIHGEGGAVAAYSYGQMMAQLNG